MKQMDKIYNTSTPEENITWEHRIRNVHFPDLSYNGDLLKLDYFKELFNEVMLVNLQI